MGQYLGISYKILISDPIRSGKIAKFNKAFSQKTDIHRKLLNIINLNESKHMTIFEFSEYT